MLRRTPIRTALVLVLFLPAAIRGDEKQPQPRKDPPPFRWVNPLKKTDLPRLTHAAFRSPSLKTDVGYCIYLPTAYDAPENKDRRFPVVYYLHGGRPGSETKSVSLVPFIHAVTESGEIAPTIYVFVNGGPVSHYNMPNQPEAQGEDVFVKELIPYVDKTYRTIADRSGRALEGFSQGGRGTARIGFKHPELFCSAAPGGGGHATEKRISENDGYENPNLRFTPGDNTWDLTRKFAAADRPPLRILVYVGTKDFNHEANLDWMAHLTALGIEHESLVVPDVPHSAVKHYEQNAAKIMQFHQESFRKAAER